MQEVRDVVSQNIFVCHNNDNKLPITCQWCMQLRRTMHQLDFPTIFSFKFGNNKLLMEIKT